MTGDGSTVIRNPAALVGETLFYLTGNGTKLGDLRQVQTDGSGDTLVTAGIYAAGSVAPASGRLNDGQLYFGKASSLLLCTPAAGAADCRTGTLSQLDLTSRRTTTLGSFVSTAAPVWSVSGLGWDGLAGTVLSASGTAGTSGTSYARRDMWMLNPGQANSLRRVTTTMP
ncbi:MAG: hypothetical protein CFE45_24425 [Burkholderiales bacterium PBB5]|nr:MAG: hypothetical protein CFE45_24425 [Burkholderiales bacterium PBB5]